MVQNAYSGIGLEPNKSTREMATKKYGLKILEAVNFYQLQAMTYDYVTMWHVLEHVPDLNQYLIELKRIVKPNGIVFIAVPNFNSYDAKHYKEFWAAFDVPRHWWHFSKYSIKKLFPRVDMEFTEILPRK